MYPKKDICCSFFLTGILGHHNLAKNQSKSKQTNCRQTGQSNLEMSMKISPSFQWRFRDIFFCPSKKNLGRSLRLKDSEAVPWRFLGKWGPHGELGNSSSTVFFLKARLYKRSKTQGWFESWPLPSLKHEQQVRT